MRTDDRRWPRATAISIALHGLLVLVVWFAATRSDRVVVFTPDEFGPRFEPGAVLPIEIATAATDRSAVEPSRGTAHEARVDERGVEARERKRVVTRGADPRPPAAAPTQSGSLHEHERGTGLLSSGREATRAFDPARLGGSRSIDEESAAGPREGPQPRPSGRAPSPRDQDSDYRFEREGSEWIYRDPGGSFVATLQPDGGVEFRSRVIEVKPGSMPSVARDGEEFITLDVEHDAIAVVELARGRDPNERAKAKLLAATFESRLEIASKHEKQRLIDRLGQLQEELEAIWSASGRSLSERKRLLFERWDACDEDTELDGLPDADSSELDQTRRQLASAARRKILRFIVEVAPAGSPEAFTDAELRAYNQRRVSEQAFAPYD